MDPREAGIDSLLRRSMAAPVPILPPDFDQRADHALVQTSCAAIIALFDTSVRAEPGVLHSRRPIESGAASTETGEY